MLKLNPDLNISVIGLGYVGLPLALAFAEKYRVKGFDINSKRLNALRAGEDETNQVTKNELLCTKLKLTDNPDDLKGTDVFIITVPTPVDDYKKPDLKPLLTATSMVAGYLERNAIVIYESTVYPGCTEEDCVPVLEKISGLRLNEDFFCGYSPERISPGDNTRTLKKIVKVTSGSTPASADFIDTLYKSIIDAGTYKATSIKVAEAAKAIENAQRDVNISFVNELSLIFDKIGIDTSDVLDAAGTKWNFLKFKPGLVGGHCIGVDPYYLAYKAESLGYIPEVILSGRRVNDNMATFVANKVVKLMIARGSSVKNAKALILGITFKENCPDLRNSKVADIYNELTSFGMSVDVYDPQANPDEIKVQYGFSLINDIFAEDYEAVILAVAHQEFELIDFSRLKRERTIIFDTKSVIERKWVDARL